MSHDIPQNSPADRHTPRDLTPINRRAFFKGARDAVGDFFHDYVAPTVGIGAVLMPFGGAIAWIVDQFSTPELTGSGMIDKIGESGQMLVTERLTNLLRADNETLTLGVKLFEPEVWQADSFVNFDVLPTHTVQVRPYKANGVKLSGAVDETAHPVYEIVATDDPELNAYFATNNVQTNYLTNTIQNHPEVGRESSSLAHPNSVLEARGIIMAKNSKEAVFLVVGGNF